jgi:hypothetical protein
MELDAQAMTRCAAETFQDPKVVKTSRRKADEAHRTILDRYDGGRARAEGELDRREGEGCGAPRSRHLKPWPSS